MIIFYTNGLTMNSIYVSWVNLWHNVELGWDGPSFPYTNFLCRRVILNLDFEWSFEWHEILEDLCFHLLFIYLCARIWMNFALLYIQQGRLPLFLVYYTNLHLPFQISEWTILLSVNVLTTNVNGCTIWFQQSSLWLNKF